MISSGSLTVSRVLMRSTGMDEAGLVMLTSWTPRCDWTDSRILSDLRRRIRRTDMHPPGA